jgi:hypothetical protein
MTPPKLFQALQMGMMMGMGVQCASEMDGLTLYLTPKRGMM